MARLFEQASPGYLAGAAAVAGGAGLLWRARRRAPFRIGVMESLTGPGETYGTVASQAKQMAVDEINAAGGSQRPP